MLTLNSARALRDGGIDAIAALNEALREVLMQLPTEAHADLKHSVGRAVAAILEETVEPAIREYPQLEPDDQTWMDVAKARAAQRAGP